MSDEILDQLKNIQEQIKKTDKKIEEIFEMQRVTDKRLSHLFNDVYKTFQNAGLNR